VWGDWEVAQRSGRGRRWDADALQAVLAAAIAGGDLHRADVADVIRPGDPTVDGALAARLLNRVGEKLRGELEDCFTWERRSRETVRITRVVDLEPALTPPAGAGGEPTTEGRSGQDG